MEPYNLESIIHIRDVDHNESLAIGPQGEAYTTSFYNESSLVASNGKTHSTTSHPLRAFRINLTTNRAEAFATLPYLTLGQVVDADGNLYCAECDSPESRVICVSPDGRISTYSSGPQGKAFLSANTPAFDRHGNMYVSDTGTWSHSIDGRIYRIPPGGGIAELWFPGEVNTPNGIALDPEEKYLYFVETLGNSISRIEIRPDGSAGVQKRILHMPRHVPDGIAFDELGRLWIACHRPDSIYVFDLEANRLELFAHDWQGEALRGPCHVAFAGESREILLASSLDKGTIHRFDNPGVRGLRLNNPILKKMR
mgnify:CR=1 FL=1|jgi:gluconolactonase